MTKPYWQITVETPRYGCAESVLEHDPDKAMKTLLEKIPSLNAGQTPRLYQVDGSVRPEYKIVREYSIFPYRTSIQRGKTLCSTTSKSVSTSP